MGILDGEDKRAGRDAAKRQDDLDLFPEQVSTEISPSPSVLFLPSTLVRRINSSTSPPLEVEKTSPIRVVKLIPDGISSGSGAVPKSPSLTSRRSTRPQIVSSPVQLPLLSASDADEFEPIFKRLEIPKKYSRTRTVRENEQRISRRQIKQTSFYVDETFETGGPPPLRKHYPKRSRSVSTPAKSNVQPLPVEKPASPVISIGEDVEVKKVLKLSIQRPRGKVYPSNEVVENFDLSFAHKDDSFDKVSNSSRSLTLKEVDSKSSKRQSNKVIDCSENGQQLLAMKAKFRSRKDGEFRESKLKKSKVRVGKRQVGSTSSLNCPSNLSKVLEEIRHPSSQVNPAHPTTEEDMIFAGKIRIKMPGSSGGPPLDIKLEKSSKTKRHPRQTQTTTRRRRSKKSSLNDDYCAKCMKNGNLICCEGCPRSFHFECTKPPLDPDNIPRSPWFCKKCTTAMRKKARLSIIDGSLAKIKGVSLLRDVFDCGESKGTFKPRRRRRSIIVKPEENSKNTLENESLPRKSSPSIHLSGKNSDQRKRKSLNMRDRLLEAGRKGFCHVCNRMSTEKNPLIRCDQCSLLWHLDCLPDPLTTLPGQRKRTWRCPVHVSHRVLMDMGIPEDRIMQILSIPTPIVDDANGIESFESEDEDPMFIGPMEESANESDVRLHMRWNLFEMRSTILCHPDADACQVPPMVVSAYKMARSAT